MSITIPQRNVLPRGASNSPRMSNAGEAVGNAWERFGRTLSDTAEGLGEMFAQMEITRNKQQLAKAQTDYQEAEAQKLLELEQDTDYEGRIDKYKTWADTQTTAITSGIKRKAVNDEFSNWLRSHRVSTETSIGLNSLQAQRRAILTDAPILQQTWIKNGDKVANDNYANDVLSKFLTPAQIDEYKNDYETGRKKLLNLQAREAIKNAVLPLIESGDETGAMEEASKLAHANPNIDYVNDYPDILTNIRSLTVQKKNNDYKAELNTALDLTNKLELNSVTMDEVRTTGIKNDDVIKNWEGWIKGANQPAPAQGTLYGADEVQKIVLGVASGEIQKLEALYALNTLRYGGLTAVTDKNGKVIQTPVETGQINPATYRWARQQLEKPFPKYQTSDIRELLIENRKSGTGKANELAESDFNLLTRLSSAKDDKELEDMIKTEGKKIKDKMAKKFISKWGVSESQRNTNPNLAYIFPTKPVPPVAPIVNDPVGTLISMYPDKEVKIRRALANNYSIKEIYDQLKLESGAVQ